MSRIKTRLWLLRRPAAAPHYDTVIGLVIRASDEAQARQMAAEVCGDEGPDVWLHAAVCIQLTEAGHPCVVLRDFNAA